MLLQTNSYLVPRQKRAEHARLLARFQKALVRVGCDLFEVYEQTDPNWNPMEGDGRFVQILRFRDREHQRAVREAERLDLEAQSLIEEFCRLINFPYQQAHGLFAVGFYSEPVLTESEGELDERVTGRPTSAALKEGNSASRGDTDLARILDEGLAGDALDIPMEAELLDPEPPNEMSEQQPKSTPAGKMYQQPR